MKFNLLEDFTNSTYRKEHYDKHVLGLHGDEPFPLGEKDFLSPEYYEYIANEIAKKFTEGKYKFLRYKGSHGGYVYYKIDPIYNAFVIYAKGYHDDGSDLLNENPQIITMYRLGSTFQDTEKKFEEIKSYFYKTGQLKSLGMNNRDKAIKDKQYWKKNNK